MLLVTPSEEWKNVTRSSPSYSFPEDDVDMSHGCLSSSSNPLPSSSSLSSGALDPTTLHNLEATPEIERWRSTISTRVVDDNRSPYAENVDGPASEGQSRATSRLSCTTDHYSAMQHTPGQGVYTTHSSSSLSLASITISSVQHPNRRSKTRELPPVPSSQGYSYTRGPPSTSSQTSFVQHKQTSQDEPPPPMPPVPASSYNSPQDSRPPISPISAPSRRATSPTSSIHSRSLPIPPSLSAKPPVPPLPLPIVPSYSNPASPDPGPGASTPPHPVPQRSRSFTHLQRDYDSSVKHPPNYSSNEHDHTFVTLPPPARSPASRAVGRCLSIRTTNISSEESAALSARSASIRASSRSASASGDGDPLDLPPAYSVLDLARSPLQLSAVSGDGE